LKFKGIRQSEQKESKAEAKAKKPILYLCISDIQGIKYQVESADRRARFDAHTEKKLKLPRMRVKIEDEVSEMPRICALNYD